MRGLSGACHLSATTLKRSVMDNLLKKRDAYEPFQIYLYEVSYYSGKMEMYLRYKEIPFQRIEQQVVDNYDVLYKNTGIMKVPVISTATDEWLKDTTPMIDWFERLYPESTVMPEDPALFFISNLVEDYADEWLWRPAMYYRWWYDFQVVGPWLARDTLQKIPRPFWEKAKNIAQRPTNLFMEQDGVTEEIRPHLEETYLKNLQSLEQILSESPFLLGERPTLVDFGYMGPMFRHFSIDPTPARIMREKAPKVFAWVARLWASKASEIDQSSLVRDFSNPGWCFILEDVCRIYLPSLSKNAIAWKDNRKLFDYETNGIHYKNLPVIQYRVWCREILQNHYTSLSDRDKDRVQEMLNPAGGITSLFEGGTIESGLIDHFVFPLKKKYREHPPDAKRKIKKEGTPWDM